MRSLMQTPNTSFNWYDLIFTWDCRYISKNGLPHYAFILCTLNKECIKADFVRKSKSRWIFSLRCNSLTNATIQCLLWLRIHTSSYSVRKKFLSLWKPKVHCPIHQTSGLSEFSPVHISTIYSTDPLKLSFHLHLGLQLQFFLRRFLINTFMHFIHRIALDLNILGGVMLCGSIHPLPHTSSWRSA
jgi:hypothetical protein